MRLYSIIEPHHLDPEICVEIIFTENDILDFYWDYWKDKMERISNKEHITESNCIDEWIVVHWAVEYDDTFQEEVEYGVVRMDYDMWKDYNKRMQSKDCPEEDERT